MACIVPGVVFQNRWALRPSGAIQTTLPIEISLNTQQFTSTDPSIQLILRQHDTVDNSAPEGAVVPAAAYVDKGSLLSVKYDFAFEPDSPRTRCVFRAPNGTLNVIENGSTVTKISYRHFGTPIVEHD